VRGCAAEDDGTEWGNGKEDLVAEMFLWQRRDMGELRHFRARALPILEAAFERARAVAVRAALD
jgi:hypothetical protein